MDLDVLTSIKVMDDPICDGSAVLSEDGIRIYASRIDVEEMAQLMVDLEASLNTITPTSLMDGETELTYHFIAGRQPIHVKTHTRHHHIPSIALLLPNAAGIEHEIQSETGIGFLESRFVRRDA